MAYYPETNEEIKVNEYWEEAAWHDDSNINCSCCPDDECTGHCMSCAYRSY